MIRQEIKRFCDAMGALATDEERGTKITSAMNKKMEEEISGKMMDIHQKKNKLMTLEKEDSVIAAEMDTLQAMLQERRGVEQIYQGMYETGINKLEDAKNRRRELMLIKSDNGMNKFLSLQEMINKKMTDLAISNTPSQDMNNIDERNRLEEEVYALEQEVTTIYEELVKTKEAYSTSMAEVCDLSQDEINASISSIKDAAGSLHSQYIQSKLQLLKLKAGKC